MVPAGSAPTLDVVICTHDNAASLDVVLDALGRQDAADSIVGAGMVLRRSALIASGWTAGPLLADRIGRRLVSGGDVEIAQRVLAHGGPLWFVPDLRIEHRIAAHRTAPARVCRLVFGLGVCESLVTALTWPGGRRGWLRRFRPLATESAARIAAGSRRSLRRREARPVTLEVAYEAGRWLGAIRVLRSIVRRRPASFGAAAIRPVES